MALEEQKRSPEARAPKPGRAQRKWSTVSVATATLVVLAVTVVAVTALLPQFKRVDAPGGDPSESLTTNPSTSAPSTSAPSTPSATNEKAVVLRRYAVHACKEHRWADCRQALDDARDLDPAGEALIQVKSVRKMIDDAKAQ